MLWVIWNWYGCKNQKKKKKKVEFIDNVNIMFPEIREIVNGEPTKIEEYKTINSKG